MPAQKLIEILSKFPEAEVRFWDDPVAAVRITVAADGTVTIDLQR